MDISKNARGFIKRAVEKAGPYEVAARCGVCIDQVNDWRDGAYISRLYETLVPASLAVILFRDNPPCFVLDVKIFVV